MDARLKNLDFVFNPRSIAFVGATESMNKWGFLILNNLLTGGYEGKVYPVNPGRETILGLPTYPSVRDIPDEVDLAIFTVPSRQVIGAVDDCAARGVKAGVVVTAGFKELGDEGAELEVELLRKGREAGMVLIGPNCQGIACPPNKLYPWMPILYHPPAGRISFVSQSGNILNMLIAQAIASGFGAAKAVSSGNEADIKTEDIISYLAEDPDTDVIVSYMEGVRDGRSLLDRASAVSGSKPIVMMKGGRTQSGISAAKSHTGAMAVSARLFESAAKQAGIIVVPTIEEAGITAASFINRPIPKGRRVGIVTGGGGLGVLAADFCTEAGLEVAKLSPPTLAQLGRLMPNWWVPGNPVDLVAGLDFSAIKPVMEILMKSGEVDSIIFLWIGSPRSREGIDTSRGGMDITKVWDIMHQHFNEYATELYTLMQELQVPLYLATTLKSEDLAFERASFNRQPVIYLSVESACRAISAMANYSDYRRSLDGRNI